MYMNWLAFIEKVNGQISTGSFSKFRQSRHRHRVPFHARRCLFVSIRCRARLFSPGSMSSATAVDRLLRTLARTRLYCNNLQDAQKELLQESENCPFVIPPSQRLDSRFSKKFQGGFTLTLFRPSLILFPAARRFYVQFAANANNRCNFPLLPPRFQPPSSPSGAANALGVPLGQHFC